MRYHPDLSHADKVYARRRTWALAPDAGAKVGCTSRLPLLPRPTACLSYDDVNMLRE